MVCNTYRTFFISVFNLFALAMKEGTVDAGPILSDMSLSEEGNIPTMRMQGKRVVIMFKTLDRCISKHWLRDMCTSSLTREYLDP